MLPAGFKISLFHSACLVFRLTTANIQSALFIMISRSFRLSWVLGGLYSAEINFLVLIVLIFTVVD